MLLPIKITGQDYVIPTTWKDVSLDLYIQLFNAGEIDDAKLISIITGIDHVELLNYNTAPFTYKVIHLLEFLKTPPDLYSKWEHESIMLGDKMIEPPKDIKLKSWWATRYVKTIMETWIKAGAKSEDYNYAVADVLVVYLQPELHAENKVNTDDYKKVKELVMKLPCEQAFQMAGFFLSKYVSYSKMNLSSQSMSIAKKNLQPVLNN